MNYLAHAYLSFGDEEVLVGNMISDYVKGKQQFQYSSGIFQGIRLHRAIDAFTDVHPATKEAAEVFKPAVGRYAAAFVDVVYDHFLAADTSLFSQDALHTFSLQAYQVLQYNQEVLPTRFAAMLPYMVRDNWLFNYRYNSGLSMSFQGLARRARYLDSSTEAFESFLRNYDLLKGCYYTFMPQVKIFATAELEVLRNS